MSQLLWELCELCEGDVAPVPCGGFALLFQESTVRVIWAYHHKDMGETGQNYHGSNRGTKSLRLLNPEREEVSSASLPYFDLTNKDVSYSMFWVLVETGIRW